MPVATRVGHGSQAPSVLAWLDEREVSACSGGSFVTSCDVAHAPSSMQTKGNSLKLSMTLLVGIRDRTTETTSVRRLSPSLSAYLDVNLDPPIALMTRIGVVGAKRSVFSNAGGDEWRGHTPRTQRFRNGRCPSLAQVMVVLRRASGICVAFNGGRCDLRVLDHRLRDFVDEREALGKDLVAVGRKKDGLVEDDLVAFNDDADHAITANEDLMPTGK